MRQRSLDEMIAFQDRRALRAGLAGVDWLCERSLYMRDRLLELRAIIAGREQSTGATDA